ncbi:phosphopantetheine-containing protein [Shewanella psychrophila]|uniref:Phosphopantetheine-containing protein n=1 Tax=Shewanella psychrophila TaxID=225848 RepID=A0A1S6HIV2_9GAMM|nr:phosphopantetheine-binding protein [Shewanella psychrophila]AQS35437.1 phosphopantetheine-containing protein [Shewanella psychrophila]
MHKHEFIALVEDFMDIKLTESAMSMQLVDLEGWDSLHAVRLLSELEMLTGHPVPIPAFLKANTLGDIHRLATLEEAL